MCRLGGPLKSSIQYHPERHPVDESAMWRSYGAICIYIYRAEPEVTTASKRREERQERPCSEPDTENDETAVVIYWYHTLCCSTQAISEQWSPTNTTAAVECDGVPSRFEVERGLSDCLRLVQVLRWVSLFTSLHCLRCAGLPCWPFSVMCGVEWLDCSKFSQWSSVRCRCAVSEPGLSKMSDQALRL